MMRPLPIAACLTIAIVIAAFAASAQTPTDQGTTDQPPETTAQPAATAQAAAIATPPPAAVGNIGDGRLLTYTCMGCHGIPGYQNVYPTYHVPKIGGQSPQYLIIALTEYKQGRRIHPTMQAQAESFSEQQIADIAAYLSSLSK